MRIKSISDALASLAAPDAQGNYYFSPETSHYSEALGYYSLTLIEEYIEALGFGLGKSRPLYVMVEATSIPDNAGDVVFDGEIP